MVKDSIWSQRDPEHVSTLRLSFLLRTPVTGYTSFGGTDGVVRCGLLSSSWVHLSLE